MVTINRLPFHIFMSILIHQMSLATALLLIVKHTT